VAVDHPVPGKRGAFRQALEDPANLARRAGEPASRAISP
jgi:hypothetical protein